MLTEHSKFRAELMNMPLRKVLEAADTWVLQEALIAMLEETELPDERCRQLINTGSAMNTLIEACRKECPMYMNAAKEALLGRKGEMNERGN
jgi:hypothetical protein